MLSYKFAKYFNFSKYIFSGDLSQDFTGFGSQKNEISSYEGLLKKGKRHGKGILTKNNYLYKGNFFRDLQHGDGKETHKNGTIYEGQYW